MTCRAPLALTLGWLVAALLLSTVTAPAQFRSINGSGNNPSNPADYPGDDNPPWVDAPGWGVEFTA